MHSSNSKYDYFSRINDQYFSTANVQTSPLTYEVFFEFFSIVFKKSSNRNENLRKTYPNKAEIPSTLIKSFLILISH